MTVLHNCIVLRFFSSTFGKLQELEILTMSVTGIWTFAIATFVPFLFRMILNNTVIPRRRHDLILNLKITF